MAKTTKKVNVKDVMKNQAMEIITKALENEGLTISTGADYGMTSGTIVIHMTECDIQIKPIAPKAGVIRYEITEEE